LLLLFLGGGVSSPVIWPRALQHHFLSQAPATLFRKHELLTLSFYYLCHFSRLPLACSLSHLTLLQVGASGLQRQRHARHWRVRASLLHTGPHGLPVGLSRSLCGGGLAQGVFTCAKRFRAFSTRRRAEVSPSLSDNACLLLSGTKLKPTPCFPVPCARFFRRVNQISAAGNRARPRGCRSHSSARRPTRPRRRPSWRPTATAASTSPSSPPGL